MAILNFRLPAHRFFNYYFGNVKFLFLNIVAALFLATPILAAKVVEDSRNRFVFGDEVANTGVYPCNNSSGGYFLPEGAFYYEDNGVPFRLYRVAVPSNEVPRVSVLESKFVELGRPLCGDPANGIADSLKFLPVSAGQPELKDGLWISEVRVPLYASRGRSVALRKEFRLQVEFSGKGSGINPGRRGIDRVANGQGASHFGVSGNSLQKKLRKEAASQLSNVNLLAQFFVGDKNLGSFSEDGLYAVPFRSIRAAMSALQRQGDVDGIPVSSICLFGSVPDTLSSSVPGTLGRSPNQLFEIPIDVRDHSPGSSSADGIFNDGDTLIFAGYGNGFWKRCDREDPHFVNGKMDYFHSYSPYSFDQGFLFGWKSSGKGLRLKDVTQTSEESQRMLSLAKDVPWLRYVRAEKDAFLRDVYFGRDLDWEGATGKEWFWIWHYSMDSTHVDAYTLKTPETSSLPGLVEGGKQYASFSYFPHRSVWSTSVMSSGDQVRRLNLSEEPYSVRMDSINFAVTVNGVKTYRKDAVLMPGGNFRIDNVKLQKTNNSYELDMLPNRFQYERFDGYSVAYQWTPVVDSAEWLLPGAVSGVVKVPAPVGTDVIKFLDLRPVKVLRAENGFAVDSIPRSGDDVRYLAVRKGRFRTGLKVEALPVPNANVLNDLSRPNSKLEYLIIAPNAFMNEAVELAKFRSDGSSATKLATSVVSLEEVYRRYTAGRLSPVAIRNYLSFVRSVCPNFRYALLVGAGTYDYRGFNSRLTPNIFPTYEAEDGVFDDFYGALDSGEVVGYGRYDLDIAVGRVPAQSPAEFSSYVQKAKEYDKLGVMDFSSWRSNLLLAADDAVNNGAADNTAHTRYQENLARMVDSLASLRGERWIAKKVYLLDYKSDAAGQKKDAAEDFINILNQGALFATYFGHGSKTDWAAEGLMKPSYISKLSNKGRYTILGSFSCTVGRYDEGNSRSLSEEMLFASGVGSIASIGATRETFGSFNSEFGTTLMKNALTSDADFIGDAYLKTKRNVDLNYSRQRYNNERYVLLGEPVVRLPVNHHKIHLDQKISSLEALDKMKLSGSVDGIEDGFVHLSMNEGRVVKKVDLQISESSFEDVFYDGALIYSEEIPIKNGRFETEFVTPMKMSIGDTAAEFRAWAYSSKVPEVGRAWINKLNITGISSYADSLRDSLPPSIQIQSCYSGTVSTSFSDGETVKLQSPACLQVIVEDSTAVDYREQADEGISFEVVGVKDQFHPWPYLEQSSRRAKLRMNFATEEYPAGKYVFKVRALDVVGNASTKTVNVEITDDMETGLADVFNAPNPMGKKGTTFYFKNLAVGRESKVNIFIYNQHGRLVKVLKNAVSGVTHWDGRDSHGRLLANGLYHYVVRSEVSAIENFKEKTWTKKQKLLISR